MGVLIEECRDNLNGQIARGLARASRDSASPEETGATMTHENAITMVRGLSAWLAERIGQDCSCGGCYLCAFNLLADERAKR